jgi:hypothetical protein
VAFVIVGLVALAAFVLYEQSNGASSSGTSGDDTTGTSPSLTVELLAKGIATAEGFYVPGSRPARDHNPGDLTADLIGKSTGMDGAFVVYATDDDGWQNLYAQIELWLSGGSAHATGDSSIADISQFYTTPGDSGNDQTNWANTVAATAGVSTDTPISQVGSGS